MTLARSGQPYTVRAIAYGTAESLEADLHIPATARPPVVCLLHGGFWRKPHDRGHLDPVA